MFWEMFWTLLGFSPVILLIIAVFVLAFFEWLTGQR